MKQKKAAALKYDEQVADAPIVSAKGKGLIADEIIEQGTKNNVPIMEDSSLVELLSELNINETIPEELYEAVAEVFSFIYNADK
ncbi:EscU/YscU/HrcU family type III secretion system export apparatus switch protein [Oceanobacillus senegalensis]|uniref:EscU/YscU/HrcU family type III secretion system export apparatus switch protein n=1 Tax=Oceanobacillus senegalensis TaxID=1936063 RepID=UPI000A30F048|nr:EscU/YscU/HrcU family type III secretion system export apparatus switch protein [Oceanobacillus senegalensis]